jgi:hypothetical protein
LSGPDGKRRYDRALARASFGGRYRNRLHDRPRYERLHEIPVSSYPGHMDIIYFCVVQSFLDSSYHKYAGRCPGRCPRGCPGCVQKGVQTGVQALDSLEEGGGGGSADIPRVLAPASSCDII